MVTGRAAVMLLLLACSLVAEVRAWQASITLPTYEEGPPDENPPFLYFRPLDNEIYPYTVRNKLTLEKARKTWRTLEIENEYLKCTVPPDLGGRLYSCIDKIGRHDLFYANPVIKKYPAGLRTAWAAAGTEFNFPAGHSWMTVSPVDFATRQNTDGSASIWVAATDRVYGMRWEVEITLRPGVDVVEQHITLSNPTAIRRRYYWWNNAEIPAFADTVFYLPCHVTSSHAHADLDSWPLNGAGVDMSRLANHQGVGVARFGIGCQEPFMGVYSAQDGSGTAHFADPAVVPGKKIWSWGSPKSRTDAAKALTDNGSEYVELQAGLFQDQETFGFLEPEQTVRFSEYWMPLRGTGGLSRLTPDAALCMERSGEKVKISLTPYRLIAQARVRIIAADRVLFEEPVDLDPARNYQRSIPNAASNLKFELVDGAGTVLLTHTEDSYAGLTLADAKRLPQDTVSTPQTEAEFMHKGKDDEELHNALVALETYQQGLAKFPASIALQRAAGRTALALHRFDEAVDRLSKVPQDAETSYYLAIAYLGLGDNANARTALNDSRDGSVYSTASRREMAKLMARSGDFRNALVEVQKLPAPGALEVALLRHLEQKAEALKCLSARLSADPADLVLRFEAAKLGTPDEALWQHLAADPQRVLDVATFYMDAGMYIDALELLEHQYPEIGALQREPGDPLPQDHPLVGYYQGLCHQKLGLPFRRDFERASRKSTLYVFPNRMESYAILRAAVKENPSDATAHFLLGSLQMSSGLPDLAILEWQTAYELHGNFPTLHANLGRLLLERKKDSETALKVFQEGIRIDPRNQALQDGLQKAIAEKKKLVAANSQKSNFFIDRAPPPVSKPEQMAQLALTMLASDRVADAAGIFTAENFAKEKQSDEVRQAFIEVRLQTILDKAKSKHCDPALHLIETIGEEDGGLPFSMYGFSGILKSARIQYYLGTAQARCGEEKAARKHWSRAAKSGEGNRPAELAWSQIAAARVDSSDPKARFEQALEQIQHLDSALPEPAYAAGILLRALGKHKEAEERFQSALRQAGNDIMLNYFCQMGLLGR